MAITEFRNLDVDTTLGGESASDTSIASQKAIKSYVDTKEAKNVKKDGGSAQQTIELTSGSGTTPFGVKSRSTGCYISFSNSTSWIGSYGVTSDKKPTFYNGATLTLAYNVRTGSANGTISVNGADVSVKGLKSAAYTDSTDYQAALVSGTNIKTVNSNSILGAGNVDIVTEYTTSEIDALWNSVTPSNS